MPSFHVVGVSHHTAPVQERERFALSPVEVAGALQKLRQTGFTAVILSTCNRCELYWWGSSAGDARFLGLARIADGQLSVPLLRHHGMAAVRHLFLVSSGLDSQILGEAEILGQVRRAYDAARAAGTTTPELDLAFSAALATGKRVRRDTLVGRHPASVSSAAVELGRQYLGSYSGRQVVVLGAGEAAEGVLRALHEQGASGVTMVTRHPERGGVLAAAWGAELRGWERLDESIRLVDLVLVATAATRPVVTADRLRPAANVQRQRPLLVLDLAVPRNVEPEARQIRGIELLDLDDLQRRCCPTGGAATDALADAEAIVEDELLRLAVRLHGRRAAPRLTELHQLSVELAAEESARALSQLKSLTDEEQEVVRRMAERLVRRVLYPVSRSLRESGVGGQESRLATTSPDS